MVRFADLLGDEDASVAPPAAARVPAPVAPPVGPPTIAPAVAPPPEPRVFSPVAPRPEPAPALAQVAQVTAALPPRPPAPPAVTPDPGPALEAAFLGWMDESPAPTFDGEAAEPAGLELAPPLLAADDDLLPRTARKRRWRR